MKHGVVNLMVGALYGYSAGNVISSLYSGDNVFLQPRDCGDPVVQTTFVERCHAIRFAHLRRFEYSGYM